MSGTAPMGSGGSLGPGALAFLLAQLGAFAGRQFSERVQTLGLNPAQAGLLRAVGAEPGRSQQAVAFQLGLFPSRLVSLVDELQRDGLLERRRDPQDRRHHALHLTAAGTERLREIGRVAQAHGEDLLDVLDNDDRAALAVLLGRLAARHELTPGVHPGYRTLGPPADITATPADGRPA
jgi:DNA-binding MarR family transcriptional regulator